MGCTVSLPARYACSHCGAAQQSGKQCLCHIVECASIRSELRLPTWQRIDIMLAFMRDLHGATPLVGLFAKSGGKLQADFYTLAKHAKDGAVNEELLEQHTENVAKWLGGCDRYNATRLRSSLYCKSQQPTVAVPLSAAEQAAVDELYMSFMCDLDETTVINEKLVAELEAGLNQTPYPRPSVGEKK